MPLPNRVQAIAELTAPGLPHELQTQTITGRELRVFVNAPPTLRALYESTASDATFLVFQDERLSFAQAWTQAGRIGALLVQRYGIVPGDRVAISMRNYPEWVLAFMAITSIGAIAVAMNSMWQPEEMAYGLNDSGAKVLFADAERIERLSRARERPSVRVIAVRTEADTNDALRLSTLLATLGDAASASGADRVLMPAQAPSRDDPATLFYTSGSTGHPKGVLSSHRAILSSLFSWELDGLAALRMEGLEPPPPPAQQPGTLLGVPLFHVTGSHAVFLMSYRLQRKLVCMHKWDVDEGARLIQTERLTSFIAPAAMTGDLVRLSRDGRYDLSSLISVGGGGAPRAPEQVAQIGKSFGQALPGTGWGMTETNAIGCGINGKEYLERPASSGRCSAVMELKVIDDTGRSLPAGERGELMVRGTGMFEGYWNRPEVNVEMIDAEGWFRTGDIAYLDDEGYVFIVDRSKDLIIRGGENIGCGAVEAAMLEHPKVHEVAVYAVPDERLGEEVGATLHGAPDLDLEELRGFLNSRLARFEVPRYIVTSPQPLPRTPSGKILKRELRDEAVRQWLPAQETRP
jgi:long-chain acyl-CoA synthetase